MGRHKDLFQFPPVTTCQLPYSSRVMRYPIAKSRLVRLVESVYETLAMTPIGAFEPSIAPPLCPTGRL